LVDAIAEGAVTVTPTSGDFGSSDLYSPLLMPLKMITFTIANGTAPNWAMHPSLSGPNASNFRILADKCTGAILRPSQDCTVTVTFQPTNRGDRSAALNIVGPAPLSVPLSGRATTPANLMVTPTEQDYGVVRPGMTSTHSFTITIAGDAPSATPDVSLSSRPEAGFSITSNSCGGPVMPGQSCEVGMTFAPTTSVRAGLNAVGLYVQAGGGTVGPVLVGYVSTGTASDGQLTLTSPGGPNPFGSVAFGDRATALFSIQNSGAIAVDQVMAAIVGETNEFRIVDNNCPAQLAVGDTCAIQVSFQPLWSGHQTSILQAYTSVYAYAAVTIGADTEPNP